MAGAIDGRRYRGATRGGAAAALLTVLLASAGAALLSGDGEGAQPATTRGSEKLPIIVHLLAGEGRGSDPSLAAVVKRVRERLEANMSPADLAAVRTFTFLPALALRADRDLIFLLLSMPEVISIERDRALRALDDASPEWEAPRGGMSEPESTLDSQEQELELQRE